ncbi:hypothetical protein DL93DRAFT_2027795, partial [Clavulina sp. PMI_390]
PKWISNGGATERNRGSIVLAFKEPEIADSLINTMAICFDSAVKFSRFEERPVKECSRCGSLEHFTTGCNEKTICKLCGSKEHHAGNHPKGNPLKCINCDGDHASTDPTCP